MHSVLEHSCFSLFVRIRLLEQYLGLVIAYRPRAAVRRFNYKFFTTFQANQQNATVIGCADISDHIPHHRMIGPDDGVSICDPKNLLLDEAEFLVVGRSSEEIGDHRPDIIFVQPGGMGMTRRDFISQSFHISPSDREERASQCM